MAAKLNRKVVSLTSGQSQLYSASTKRPEVIYVEREVELRALEFQSEVFKIQVSNLKGRTEIGLQTLIEYVEDLKEQLPIEKIKRFLCEDCQNHFSTEQSMKRHLKEVHSGKAKIYFKHEKVDGRYQCTSCIKSKTHIAKVKQHMQKHHLREAQETEKIRIDELTCRQYNSSCFQAKAMSIPALNAINLSSCIENYLHITVPNKAKLIVVDEYAYKVYPFSYLLKNEQYQNEFANEYMILREAQRKDCKNLLKLDGIIISYGFIALRLKKYEMTLRDYLYHNRYPDDLNDILSQMIKNVKELHELGYIHRDLKPENVMLILCHSEVVVIDFNRALRQKIVTLAKILGTPGYFPIREKWTNGSVQWDLWAVAAIILESDMECMSYYGTKQEKQSISLTIKHIKQDDFCKEIKQIVDMIIVREPSYPRQSLDDLLEPLQRPRFKGYNKDKQIKFV